MSTTHQLYKLDKHRNKALVNNSNKVIRQWDALKTLNSDHVLLKTFIQTNFAVFKTQLVSVLLNRSRTIKDVMPHEISIPDQVADIIKSINSVIDTDIILTVDNCVQNAIQLSVKNKKHMRMLHCPEVIAAGDMIKSVATTQSNNVSNIEFDEQSLVSFDSNTIEVSDCDIQKIKNSIKSSHNSIKSVKIVKKPIIQSVSTDIITTTKTETSKQLNTIAVRKSSLSAFRYNKMKISSLIGNYCYCCGARPGMFNDDNQPVLMTGDHIQVLSDNHHLASHLLNIQILCHDCNQDKGNIDNYDFRTIKQINTVIKHCYNYEPQNEIETIIILRHHVYKHTQKQISADLNMKPYVISKIYCNMKSLLQSVVKN